MAKMIKAKIDTEALVAILYERVKQDRYIARKLAKAVSGLDVVEVAIVSEALDHSVKMLKAVVLRHVLKRPA